MPPITTDRPISPGPSLNGELGETPRANTGTPTASMPSTSRTRPSVTQATTPLLCATPSQASPTTEACS